MTIQATGIPTPTLVGTIVKFIMNDQAHHGFCASIAKGKASIVMATPSGIALRKIPETTIKATEGDPLQARQSLENCARKMGGTKAAANALGFDPTMLGGKKAPAKPAAKKPAAPKPTAAAKDPAPAKKAAAPKKPGKSQLGTDAFCKAIRAMQMKQDGRDGAIPTPSREEAAAIKEQIRAASDLSQGTIDYIYADGLRFLRSWAAC